MKVPASNTVKAPRSARYMNMIQRVLSEYQQARIQIPDVTREILHIFADGDPTILKNVAAGLAMTSPGHPDLPMLHSVIHDLRCPIQAVGPGKGNRPTISIPLRDVPVTDLERIRSSRHQARQEHLIYTYRQILGAARRAGLPEVLNRARLSAFRKELGGRAVSSRTMCTRFYECQVLAELWNLDNETMALISRERRAARIKVDQEPSARHAAFRAAPLTPLDYARQARVTSEEAYRCSGNRQSIHRLFVTAAALALLSFIPERVSDILKLVVGRDVVRNSHCWSSHYFSNKTDVDRSVECLPSQLTPFLDDLMLLGANPGPQGRDLLRLYRHRVAIGSPLFARTDLRKPYSAVRIFELVKERTGHGPHAARKAMTDYLVEIDGSRAEIMSLLGHRRASTSQQHYEVRAAAIRRKRTTEKLDGLRKELAQKGAFRLSSGRMVDLNGIHRDLDRTSQT